MSDELDLDELECAQLFLQSQTDAQEWDRSPIVSAIIRFHRRRQFLLESLRTAFEFGYEQDLSMADPDSEDEELSRPQLDKGRAGDMLQKLSNLVVGQPDGIDKPPQFWKKCLLAMKHIEAGIQRVVDRTQRASVVGQALSTDEEQIMAYERETLQAQHETLAVICTILLRKGFATLENFRELLNRAKTLDKHDVVMLHYVPVLLASTSLFASAHASCTPAEAQAMHNIILAYGDNNPWALRTLYQAFSSRWIVEYKERFPDAHGVDSATTSDSQALTKSLRDGGLQFMLSIAQDVKRSDWYDPAKVGLTNFLLREATTLPPDSPPPSKFFTERVMDELQAFVDAFITNMPDTLRLLKFEEDDQRKLLRSRFHKNTTEYQYDLDVFLVLIAYAYQDDPDSAKSFWGQQEGNLYGFLQWSAKRQTTPRVAAFCEMLRSISEGPCANFAHQFLLQEGTPVAGKLRRTTSISWTQIFTELEFYATSIKDRPATITSPIGTDTQQNMEQLIEPESAIMLECYLRLVTHLCHGSPEARSWLWAAKASATEQQLSLPMILFQLCQSNIESRLRGCAFATLASLLTDKPVDVAEHMWVLLDGWIAGGISSSSNLPRIPHSGLSSQQTEQMIFEMISSGFEEPNSFLQLLNALIAPIVPEEGTIPDDVPFPQSLGSSYRSPGIEAYVDFAIGKIFANKTTELTDQRQLALLRLNCLDFICTCLSTFNEDVVIIANKSNLPVEKTLKSSSLSSYVTLHPFSRVMEWLFQDKCLDALFAAAHQDITQLNERDSNSPVVLSTVRAIEVMNLIMRLQSTYVDIVKPTMRQNTSSRKSMPASAVSSFEEAVSNRLDLVLDLGLYCGLGHSELTICALGLLEKLSSSRKLSSPSRSMGRGRERNKLISVLEKDLEAHRISRSLTMLMTWDPREFEAGFLAAGYSVKSGILSFLKNCLATTPDKPTIAHLLLGFTCNGNELEIDSEGIFSMGQSLFHSVARLALEYPDSEGGTFISWASNIKEACIEVLRILCQSPISGQLVMAELRLSDYAFLQAIRQTTIGPNTPWDGLTSSHPDFLVKDTAIGYRNFLRQRAGFYDYVARELRYAKQSKISSLLLRLQETLLGSSSFPGEGSIPNPTVFELLDFLEVGFSTELAMPKMKYFKESDFAVCKIETSGPGELFGLSRAHEVILLRRREYLTHRSSIVSTASRQSVVLRTEDKDLKDFDNEAEACLLVLLSRNHWRDLTLAQFETLKAWIRLVVVTLESCEFTADVRNAFIQQAYQLVLPKFDKAKVTDLDTAIELAAFLNQLMVVAENGTSQSSTDMKEGSSSLTASVSTSNRISSLDGGNDITIRVFQAALGAIITNTSPVALRQPCYQICYRFLRRILNESTKSTMKRRNVLRTVKSISDRLIEVLCDDVYTGDAQTRIFSLLVLEELVALSAVDEPKLILDALDRLNFIGLMTDSVKQIPTDLRHVAPAGE